MSKGFIAEEEGNINKQKNLRMLYIVQIPCRKSDIQIKTSIKFKKTGFFLQITGILLRRAVEIQFSDYWF